MLHRPNYLIRKFVLAYKRPICFNICASSYKSFDIQWPIYLNESTKARLSFPILKSGNVQDSLLLCRSGKNIMATDLLTFYCHIQATNSFIRKCQYYLHGLPCRGENNHIVCIQENVTWDSTHMSASTWIQYLPTHPSYIQCKKIWWEKTTLSCAIGHTESGGCSVLPSDIDQLIRVPIYKSRVSPYLQGNSNWLICWKVFDG